MSNSKTRCIVAAAILLVWALLATKFTRAEARKVIAVGITGVHHMGKNFNVPEFYVDGAWASNVGREGGGGRSVCCIMIPREWRDGMVVEIRWAVTDWRKENVQETDKGNYSSLITDGTYKATVPVEKFSAPGQFYVHFFEGGKVRAISSTAYPEERSHPIQDGDETAGNTATRGEKIDELFTDSEIKLMGMRK